MNKKEIKFIDRLYKDLYLNDSLKKHTTSKDKYKSIKEYIEFLESIHNRIIDHNHIDTLKKMYYDKYVINEENIPDSYYKHQEEMYLERGYGHVTLSNKEKQELQEQIINDQKKSLDVWLDYLLSEDSSYIPFWAKYWAFQGMLKLGNFDKEKGKYTKRTKHTVSKFVDLNREVLALSIDTLLKYLDKKDINDQELEQLVKTGSFQSIYTYITNKILSDNSNITKRNEGKWIKYDRGSDHMPLVNSLQGYNTGWCTAGESTAHQQLSNGDFYVYYTKDENDEYKIPRIAIRMEGNSIGEIRGVAENQNLEPDMEEIVKEKIKDFPGKDEYYKKVSDMEKLTKIYKKYNNNEILTKEELKFLYEIDSKIEGFGYRVDPRIEEIISKRNIKKDISFILDIKEEVVALSKRELSNITKYFYGALSISYKSKEKMMLPEFIKDDLSIIFLDNPNNLVLPKIVGGNLYLEDLKLECLNPLDNVKLPECILGNFTTSLLVNINDLKISLLGELQLIDIAKTKNIIIKNDKCKGIFLPYLEKCESIKLPKVVDGGVYLNSLKSFNSIILPEKVKKTLQLSNLDSCKNLKLPSYIGEDLILNSLQDIKYLKLPDYIGGTLYLNKLETAKDLKIPNNLKCTISLKNLKDASSLKLPEKYEGGLYLDAIMDVKELKLPVVLGGSLSLASLNDPRDLKLPKEIGNSLYLNSVLSAKNLKFPKKISGILNLEKLVDAEGLMLPNETGMLCLNSLKKANKLILPRIINGLLQLTKLEEVDYLKLPEKISDKIFLNNLRSAKKIILPQTATEIFLNNFDFEDIDSFVFPPNFSYTIYLHGLILNQNNINKYRKQKKIIKK